MAKGYIINSASNAPPVRFTLRDDIPAHIYDGFVAAGLERPAEDCLGLYADAFGVSAAVFGFGSLDRENDAVAVYGLPGNMTFAIYYDRNLAEVCIELAARMWSHRAAKLCEPPENYRLCVPFDDNTP